MAKARKAPPAPKIDARGATTPGLGFPYPVPADPADVPADMKKLAEAVEASLAVLIPAGLIAPFGGGLSAIPAGWVACDGRAVDRVVYSRLFAAIGIVWGAGDGTTTFNVPDLTGRVPVGKASSGTFYTVGAKGGEETHAITVAEMPAHAHTSSAVSAGTPAGAVTVNNAGAIATGTESADHTHAFSGSTAAAGAGEAWGPHSALNQGSQSQTFQGPTGALINNSHAHSFSGGTGGRSSAHSHTLPAHGHTASFAGSALATHAHTIDATGGGGALSLVQPFAVVTYMVKA